MSQLTLPTCASIPGDGIRLVNNANLHVSAGSGVALEVTGPQPASLGWPLCLHLLFFLLFTPRKSLCPCPALPAALLAPFLIIITTTPHPSPKGKGCVIPLAREYKYPNHTSLWKKRSSTLHRLSLLLSAFSITIQTRLNSANERIKATHTPSTHPLH